MLILVTGLPGSGKSTVARLIAKKIDAVYLSSDIIRRELFPEHRDYSSGETGKVITEQESRTIEALSEGRTVVLDALFTKQGPRNFYKKLAESLNIEFKIILVQADEAVIKQRLESRTGDPSEATFAYYLDRKPHFEPVEGKHFIIDNSGDLHELEQKIISLDLN